MLSEPVFVQENMEFFRETPMKGAVLIGDRLLQSVQQFTLFPVQPRRYLYHHLDMLIAPAGAVEMRDPQTPEAEYLPALGSGRYL